MSKEANESVTEKKKSSLGKKIARIVAVVLVLLAALIIIALWQIDRIVATGTRTVGSQLTGTKVDVKSVSIKPFAGAVKIGGFEVGNPAGFQNPTAITVGNFHVDLNMDTLLSDTLEIAYLEISGMTVDFEYNLGKGSNIQKLIENVEHATGADKAKAKAAEKPQTEAPAEAEAEEAAQKKVIIRKLVIKDCKVTLSSSLLKTSVPLYLPPVEMENVGEGKNIGETITEVLSRLLLEITKLINTQDLNKAFSGLSDGIISGLDSVGGAADSTVKDAVKGVEGLFKKLKKK